MRQYATICLKSARKPPAAAAPWVDGTPQKGVILVAAVHAVLEILVCSVHAEPVEFAK